MEACMNANLRSRKGSLPARPNLDHLRSQAKALLADLRDGKASAAQTFVAHLPAASRLTPAQVRGAGFRLADAQSAIARKSGFKNWPGLARHVEQLRALEGDWAFQRLEVDGRAMPVPETARLLIDGDRFRMESPEASHEGEFNIDVEQDLPRIDIEFIAGPETGEWSYGIYRLDGDDLTLCLGLAGSPRPTRFATTAGSGHALERLRRVSSERPQGVTGGTRSAAARQSEPARAVDEAAFTLRPTPLLERLQGTWRPVSLVTSGKPLDAAFLAYGSRTQTGNETRVVFGGQTIVHALMNLDELASPVAIDYLNIGKGPRAISLGILDWIGDDLRVCMAKAGETRPSDFSCDPGSGRTLSRWRRT
jgi:uncharacterized protein (TIGR03067 family)